ncbi:hypothetical protein QJV15_07710 [Listeria cossartiae subsp. cayugensis]|uniref:hypothetical protein n=1 Tax=Listeria TaxID=1637 RepID=UPI001629EE24|nr:MULTISPECIES: hypothetical protein [Listeria]MBC2000860.1 hypothetical protein [Listeria marthii]MDT0000746.1 hypothetical protein [Listeria cossartiae subsp. cayugensis]MDT0009150.1 hypothetical protein [Listeria cossartiae subsp. cayugensis]MDT0030982.1 hypothetical protein [Listeria cossartiae subsp. cayugensis]MDT0039097.1 hypothetical protein [Listeria cossartiae subsp. cayugensis]
MVKLVVQKKYQHRMTEDAKKELVSVQDYLDANPMVLQENTINCLILEGRTIELREKMHVVLVLINQCDFSVNAMKFQFKIKCAKEPKLQFAEATIYLDPDYLGQLNTGEGIIFHIEIPIKGKAMKDIYKNSDLKGELTQVQVGS